MPGGYDLPPEMPISRFVSPFVRAKRRYSLLISIAILREKAPAFGHRREPS